MQPFIAILFKSVVVAAIMLAYYVLALRNKRLHTYNRAYLLVTMLASIIVPFLNFNCYQVEAQSAPAIINVLQVTATGVEEQVTTATNDPAISLTEIALYGYALISFLLLAVLGYRIVWLLRQKRSHTVRMKGYNFIYSSLPGAPFSFFNNLFWNENIDIDSPEGNRILQHELAHIRQKHSIDKLTAEIAIALCWLNPFLWYIRQELAQVHEFLADEQAITDNDTSAFAQMLLAVHYKNILPPITSSYFHSPVKRRIIMLNQNKPRLAGLRRALALPVLIAPVLLLSFTTHKLSAPEPVLDANKTTIIIDAGHGGNDAGGIGLNSILEKDLSLKMCRKMATLAKEYNLNVVIARNGDEYPTLQQRAEISNRIANGIFISLHVDKNGPAHTAGYSIIVSEKNSHYSESKLLASAVANNFSKAGIEMRLAQQGLHVLKANNHPAIAIECGNIDKAADVARIQDDAQLEAMCRHILSGIATYVGTTK